MKKFNKIGSFVITAVLLLGILSGLTSCGDGENEIKVWSTYNTLKVMRDEDEYPDLGQKLDVFMAKAETEGAQLLVTPKKDIKNIELKASDLTQADGTVFSKTDVSVYMQKYMNVPIKTKGQTNYNYPTGYTPDLMLPMNLAVEYNENNVGAGHNQGFTVEFKTTVDTKEGLYTGTFTLVADAQIFMIPVTLDVYDIDLTGANGMTSIRAIARANLNGEYNNSPELYRNYYETSMNDYKFTLDLLPGASVPEDLAKSAVHYWDNPNFTSFLIPTSGYQSNHSDVNLMLVRGEMYSYMYALAKASAPGMILFDKAYIYPWHLDEPHSTLVYEAVIANTEAIYEIEDKVFADLEKEGYFDEYDSSYKDAFKKSISSVTIVIAVDGNGLFNYAGDAVNSYCLRLEFYNTPTAREQYKKAAAANAGRGGEMWFYTCMLPLYPYPSHHIDDALIGSRVMRWMQKDYGFTGYLHWSFDSYHIWTGTSTLNCDPYETVSRFPNTVGDGFMFYPGKKYGVDTYLPSLRLATFRDGQEDYDTLCALDKIIAEKESYFGLPSGTVSTSTYTQNMYNSLYTGTIYNESDAQFYDVRRELFEAVEKHRSGTKFLVDTKIVAKQAISNIYLSSEYELTVNGDRKAPAGIAGAGVKYTVTQNLDKRTELNIVITKGGAAVEKYNIFIASETHAIELNNEDSPLYLSETSVASYAGNEAQITLKTKGETVNEILMFEPAVGIKAKALTVSLDKVEKITFTVENTMDTALEFRLRFKSGYSTYDLGLQTFAAGEKRTVTLSDIYNYGSVFSNLSTATLEIHAANSANGVLLPDKQFTLSNINYSIIEEGN